MQNLNATETQPQQTFEARTSYDEVLTYGLFPMDDTLGSWDVAVIDAGLDEPFSVGQLWITVIDGRLGFEAHSHVLGTNRTFRNGAENAVRWLAEVSE